MHDRATNLVFAHVEVSERVVLLEQDFEVLETFRADLVGTNVEVFHLWVGYKSFDHLLGSNRLEIVVLNIQLSQRLVDLEHLKDVLHTFASYVVPAEIEVLDGHIAFEAFAQALEAILTDETVTQAKTLKLMKSAW